MKSFRAITFPIFGLLVVALAGCSGETGAANTVTTSPNGTVAQTETASNVGDRGHHARRPHGPDAIVFASLHENINLTDAQRSTIQGAADTLKQSMHAEHDADRARMASLAAAIRAGKVDATSLPPRDETARLAASAKAVDTVHATLSKEQRTALVDALTKHADHDRAGWKNAKAHMGGEHKDHGDREMHGMFADLNLTKAQEDAIKAKLDADRPQLSEQDKEAMKQKFELVRSEMLARLQTFANDSFDAKAFVAPPSSAPKMDRADFMVKRLAAVTSVLDAAQREKLATRFEQGPRGMKNFAPGPQGQAPQATPAQRATPQL